MRAVVPVLFMAVLLTDCHAQTTQAPQTPAALPAVAKFDVNDVSWLLPPPATPADVASLISVSDIQNDGQPVFSPDVFSQLMEIAASDAAKVTDDARINLPAAAQDLKNWKIAAFRVDPSAPGGDPGIAAKLGSAPQIRLIVQPVTVDDNQVHVHDIAVHLVYTFAKGKSDQGKGNFPKPDPDQDAFNSIVSGLAALKKQGTDAGFPTDGVPLGVHPGLKEGQMAGLQAAAVAFLSSHLSSGRLSAMAIMALPNEFEPWVFVGTIKGPDGKFIPFLSPGLDSPAKIAQMLRNTGSGQFEVVPTPVTNNRNPATNVIFVPPASRSGVSTSVLFNAGLDPNATAVIGTGADGQPRNDLVAKNSDIPDIVNHPALSHFFNTDCVSCHTATRRAAVLNLKPGSLAMPLPAGVSGLDPAVAPQDDWNLRNFGWFQSLQFLGPKISATVSQRTLNETAAVVQAINNLPAK